MGAPSQIHASEAPYESDIAQLWWTLSPGCRLPLSNGETYQLVFAGQPGGPMGPDVRDAVFSTSFNPCTLPDTPLQGLYATRRVGDVEFHVRASDWVVHQHHTDPRYNAVILHIVFICDDTQPTMRQDGVVVPVCSLYDLPRAVSHAEPFAKSTSWACHLTMERLSEQERERLFLHAGLLRFEQKAHVFVEQLHALQGADDYNACLLPALAEGLGYGRDRDFFRAVGLSLLGKEHSIPEPLGRSPLPAPLDVTRLRVLALLIAQWRNPGIWQTLRKLFLPAQQPTSIPELLQALRSLLCGVGLSLARTDILICNVILPFAVAVALVERDAVLAERAQACYIRHPGLPSNRVTRMMCAQLQLPREPQGSCQQQGLHYIYQHTCREKLCAMCIMGKNDI